LFMSTNMVTKEAAVFEKTLSSRLLKKSLRARREAVRREIFGR
jgi:hypothetical protein